MKALAFVFACTLAGCGGCGSDSETHDAGIAPDAAAPFNACAGDPGGFVLTAIIGIVGALLAGWAGRAVGWYGPDDNAGFLMSILGAVILLVIYHGLVRRRAITP